MFKIDWKNLHDYMEYPFTDDETSAKYKEVEDDYISSEDIDSIPDEIKSTVEERKTNLFE